MERSENTQGEETLGMGVEGELGVMIGSHTMWSRLLPNLPPIDEHNVPSSFVSSNGTQHYRYGPRVV